jgi:hypothetical protein
MITAKQSPANLAARNHALPIAVSALLSEIASIEAMKDDLPDDSPLRSLCDLAIRPLRDHAEALQSSPAS